MHRDRRCGARACMATCPFTVGVIVKSGGRGDLQIRPGWALRGIEATGPLYPIR